MRRYAITNRTVGAGREVKEASLETGFERLQDDVRRWARDEVDYVQLREKGLSDSDMAWLTKAVLQARDRGTEERVRAVAEGAGVRTQVLINTAVAAALAAGADGVHLTASPALQDSEWADLNQRVAAIRWRFRAAGRPEPTLSMSCHTVPEVLAARAAGVDLLLFGPVFGKVVGGTPVGVGVGLDSLRAACDAAAGLPVYALGGVTAQNAATCLSYGAAGVAGIRIFQGSLTQT